MEILSSMIFKNFPNVSNEVTLILDYSILLVTETYFLHHFCLFFLNGGLKKLPSLEIVILWRFRQRSRETNIPAAGPILSRAKGEPCFYTENWEQSQEKPEQINPMQNVLLGNGSHPGWASQVKWNEEGTRLSQQKDKHMECSRNLKYFT